MNTDKPSNKNQDEAQPCEPVDADLNRPLGGGAVQGGRIGGTAKDDEWDDDFGGQTPGRNPQGGHTGQRGGGQSGQKGRGRPPQGDERGGRDLVDPPENADLGGDEDTPSW